MTGAHDRGGRPGAGPIDRSEHQLEDWELLTDALLGALAARSLLTVDEHRRAMEGLEPAKYESLPYYGRWIHGLETLLVEKAILRREEIDARAAQLAGDG